MWPADVANSADCSDNAVIHNTVSHNTVTSCPTYVRLLLGHRLRRWPNIKPTYSDCTVFCTDPPSASGQYIMILVHKL